jgi:hypothetical protein
MDFVLTEDQRIPGARFESLYANAIRPLISGAVIFSLA